MHTSAPTNPYTPSVSSRDHQPWRLAVLSLLPQLAQWRGAAVRPRDHRDRRSHPPVFVKFGPPYANQLRRRRPRPGDTWHLDEVLLTINGVQSYLWRVVDQDGYMLDILVQSHRNKNAPKKFFRKRLKGLRDVPRVIITDQLNSYGATHGWGRLQRPLRSIRTPRTTHAWRGKMPSERRWSESPRWSEHQATRGWDEPATLPPNGLAS
jgi:hypothetical protein